MARRVMLHVGTPKTGTSYVQEQLFEHRESLAEQGILYPADRFDAHFLAALDLMQLPWGGLEAQAIGRWDAMAAQVREHDGVAIISHEILGRASRLQVERALSSFGDAEVHVMVSARDLIRQIPAEWQENLKHRRTVRFADFLDEVQDPAREAEIAQWFWSVQELPDVLERWGGTLPRERVHLVTVPPRGAEPGLLWQRFERALGLEGLGLAPAHGSANTSLGVWEAELIRRVNARVNGVLNGEHYRGFVREFLVHRTLSRQPAQARLALPPRCHEWAAQRARSWVVEIAMQGYDVVGDLDDLLGGPAQPFADPDQPDEAAINEAAVRAIGALAGEAARLRDVEIELHEIVDDLAAALDRARSTRVYRTKEKLVGMAETNPLARAGLGAYRLARGRNSRST